MNRVVHFEIQADNIERAVSFYKNVFNWSIDKWTGMDYWIVMTAEKDSKEPGINGGLLQRPSKIPLPGYSANAFVCTVQVENFDTAAEKIIKNGGTAVIQKYALTGMAWQGYFLDTEGNTIGIHQADENAR